MRKSNPKRISALRFAVWLGALLTAPSAPAEPHTIVLRDHLDHTWRNELVSFPIEFGPGECWETGLRLVDEGGKPMAVQLTGVQTHKGGSLSKATLWFIVPELPANQQRAWQVVPGRKQRRPPAYKTDLAAERGKDVWEITTSKVGVRLLAGEKQFDPALPARSAPAPLQAIRLRSGSWIGRGWWETERPCTGYRSEMTASGPVFAEVRVRCLFDGGKHYTATYRVIAGEEVVLIEEEFSLGNPKRFVIPAYDEKYRLQWDWWGGTHGRAESPNNLYFSIYDGRQFVPDTGRWGGAYPTLPEKKGPEYKLDFSVDRLDVVLNSYLQWGQDESLFYTTWNAQTPGDAVTVIAIRPSKWIHPDLLPHTPPLKQHTQTNDIGVWVNKTPDLYLRAPVNMGKRAFLLAALDAKTEIAPRREQFDRVGEIFVKYAQKPLDKIKDWVLDWPETAKHPLLFCEPGDLAAMMRRAKSWQGPFPSLHASVFQYLLTGGEKEAVQAFGALRGLRNLRDLTLRGYGEPSQHQGWGWTMNAGGPDMDMVLSSPALSPEQRKEARAVMAYLQYCAWDPDHFPGRELGFAWGSANQGSIMLTARSLWARLLADHPMAERWAAGGANFLVWDLERFLHPESGVAQDCMAYAGAAICPNLVGLLALQGMVDVSPILPRLRALASWRLTTMPPPDVRFGQRTLVTLGDSPYHGDNIAGVLGMVLLKSDPELAAQCLWAFRQSGRPGAGFVAGPYVIDDSLPDAPPVLSSKSFSGSCAILRTGTGRDDETYLCYYHGSFNWGHHHNDQGTLVFYAKGAPLMMDFGSQYVPRIDRSCFHNTLSFNHQETEKLTPCPGRGHKDCFYTKRGGWIAHEEEPHTCFEYSMNPWEGDASASLGDIKEFAGLPEADYARGEQRISRVVRVPYRYDKPACDCPGGEHESLDVAPFVWSRQVVLVKDNDPMGPNYFLVHDDLTGNEKLEPAFNLWSLTREVQSTGNRSFLPGQWGVDLDVFIAEPAAPRTVVAEVAHQAGSDCASKFQNLHKRPFEERQKLLRIHGQPGGGGFALVVYPRKPGEPKPEFAALPGVPGVKVTLPNQTHWVIASRKEVTLKEPEFTFSGTVAVVKRLSEGRRSVSLLAGGRFEAGKRVLQSPGPAHLTLND